MRAIEGIRYRAVWRFRALTQRFRVLPDFIIIGGMKCGTTALYRYLVHHPQVVPAAKKEVHFFDNQYERGLRWYKHYFPLSSQMTNRITGEASPYYIFHPIAPIRIKKDLPNVKLIALLRNPVDRAFSHYHHTKRKGYETLPFEEAIELEIKRIKGERKRIENESDYKSHVYQAYSYVSRGIYWRQLERYYDQFDASSILVIKSEDLLVRPQSTVDVVTDFLSVERFRLYNANPVNKAHYARRQTRVHNDLREFFRPHNERLYELVGRDFGWEGE